MSDDFGHLLGEIETLRTVARAQADLLKSVTAERDELLEVFKAAKRYADAWHREGVSEFAFEIVRDDLCAAVRDVEIEMKLRESANE